MNILIIIAHPDDEIFGMGGTLNRFVREGHKVSIICATSSYQLGASEPHRKALQELCTSLGISLKWLDFNAYELAHKVSLLSANLTARVKQFFEENQRGYDLVFTHSRDDMNVDHRAVNTAVRVAFRNAAYCPHILFFNIPGNELQEVSKAASCVFYELESADIDFKLHWALRYGSHQFVLKSESLLALSTAAGARIGSAFAEEFTPYRIIHGVTGDTGQN